MRSLTICTPHEILYGLSNKEECKAVGLKHVWGRGKVHTGVWCGNLKERDHLEEAGVDGRIILEWIFRNLDGGHGLD